MAPNQALTSFVSSRFCEAPVLPSGMFLATCFTIDRVGYGIELAIRPDYARTG